MKYRLATVFAEKTFTADATEIIEMNIADPISELIIRFQPKNGAEADPSGHPIRCLEKIELVDGSDVIFSLSGVEAHALDWYNNQIVRPNILWYLTNLTFDCALHISFGRFAMDPLLAFDPKKFRNPQLKISLNIDAGGMNTSQVIVSVLARTFDEKAIKPVGFLMNKEIKDYSLGAGTREYTDLPTDYPMRKLLLRSQKYGSGLEHCFDEIKLSEDNDKKVPIHHKIEELLHAITGYSKPYREWILTNASTAGRYIFNTPGYCPAFSATACTPAVPSHQASIYEGDGGRAKVYKTTDAQNIQIMCMGWCPHSTIEIPFGMQNEIDDWYDVTKLGSLRLNMKAGSGMSASETCQVFLQQLRKYVA